MSGIMILAVGIALAVAAVILFIASVVYRQTAGRRIREELTRDYE